MDSTSPTSSKHILPQRDISTFDIGNGYDSSQVSPSSSIPKEQNISTMSGGGTGRGGGEEVVVRPFSLANPVAEVLKVIN